MGAICYCVIIIPRGKILHSTFIELKEPKLELAKVEGLEVKFQVPVFDADLSVALNEIPSFFRLFHNPETGLQSTNWWIWSRGQLARATFKLFFEDFTRTKRFNGRLRIILLHQFRKLAQWLSHLGPGANFCTRPPAALSCHDCRSRHQPPIMKNFGPKKTQLIIFGCKKCS